jgi:hypothetical protein
MTADIWRAIERALLAYFQSYRVHTGEITGTPVVEVVRYREAEEIATASLSLEQLAKHLAEEFKIPA